MKKRIRRSWKTVKPAASPKLHLGYVRVSSLDQRDNGCSIATQDAKVRAHAFVMERDLTEVISDAGESAKTLDRPGMVRLLDLIRAGKVASLTAAKLDRFTRSVRDLADLLDLAKKHDVAVVSVGDSLDTSSASGRMVTNIMGAVSQGERELIAERTATAMQHLISTHRSTGGRRPRYGYRFADEPRTMKADGSLTAARLVPDDAEQANIVQIHALGSQGSTIRAISAALAIAPMTVQRVLKAQR